MSVRTSWFTMDGKLGVNLNRVVTSVTVTNNPAQPEYPGIPHNVGDRVQGNNGSEWIFCLASTTVTAFNMVAIDKTGVANNVTTGTFSSGVYSFGIAQFQIYGGVSTGVAPGGVCNAGDYFFALVKANDGLKVNIATDGSVAVGSALYVSSTAGRLAVSGSVRANGIQAAVSGSGTAVECIMFGYILPAILLSASALSS